MFSLSDPCPDASKTLWEIPPPPSAPALITGEECEAQSAAPPAAALGWARRGAPEILGAHREGGQERGESCVPHAGGTLRGLSPLRGALAAVPEQQDMSNPHPTGGGTSKAPGEIQEVSASQTRAAAVQ